jgi:LuxR family maltose regulon positive regulatory protein
VVTPSFDPAQDRPFGQIPAGYGQGLALLKTKLYVPLVRPEWVSRPRLVEHLSQGSHHKLAIISAPAGFGKTTLLSEWVMHHHVAWVSLDEGDNDPIRFWSHVIAALQTLPDLNDAGVGQASLAMLQATEPSPTEALLVGLINEVAGLPATPRQDRPYILVLDDLHLITNAQIHQGLVFLVDNLPPQMHLVVSGRADPPWPLASLRARRELTEIRTPDLRFTPEEATAFLNETMGLHLASQDITALEERTEGWVAGLQMAAISVRERERRQGAQGVSGFVKAFSASNRFVLDYLVEEVLDHQPPELLDFLLKTSILARLTAPLCEAVLDGEQETKDGTPSPSPPNPRPKAQQILERLEAANLFIIPLDDERHWYRYHHLFADLLRRRLRQQVGPGGIAHLHHRASEWYGQSGYIPEAVRHALAAGDFEQAADLVEQNLLVFRDHGELPMVVKWLDSFPETVLQARPWLCIAKAWMLAYVGQLDATEPLLQCAEQGLDGLAVSEQRSHAKGHIAAIRCYVRLFRGDLTTAAQWGRSALEFLPEQDVQTRRYAATSLASALRLAGDIPAAVDVLTAALAFGQKGAGDQAVVRILCALGGMQRIQGKIGQAAVTCRQAIQFAGQDVGQGRMVQLPIAGHAHVRLANALYLQNDLENALHHAQAGLALCKTWGQANALWEAYDTLSEILQARGDASGALDAIQQAEQVASSISPFTSVAAAIQRVSLQLRQGDLEAATAWAEAQGLAFDDDVAFQDLEQYSVYAQILIRQGERDASRLVEAEALLERLDKIAQASGAGAYELAFLVWRADAIHKQGNVERALPVLERALQLAEPEGVVHIFIEGGDAMARLLWQATTRGLASNYAGRLLADMGVATEQKGRIAKPPLSKVLIEPLTDRELEVLRLLSTGLTGPEIAEELVISVHTFRSHVKSIYGKLGAHSRIEAVARAQELNLM